MNADTTFRLPPVVVFVAIMAVLPALGGAQTVVVVNETNSDWAFVPETGSPSYEYAQGPGAPPAGDGSATFSLGDTADGAMLWTALHAGTSLAEITTLSYATYQNTAPQAAALQLNLDYDDTDGFSGWQGRLVFEPYHGHIVAASAWQSWDTLDGTGSWWSTGTPVVGDVTATPACVQAAPCSWEEVLTAYPNAAIHQGDLAGLLLKAGSGWPAGFEGAADALHLATGAVDVLYDFEHIVGEETATSRLSMNGWYSDDTRADGTATAPEVVGTDLVSPTLTDDPEATASGNPAHDDDIDNQILFPLLGPPEAPPAGTWQGSVCLRIAAGVNPGKSQISHRKDDGTGFAAGSTVLAPGFWLEYSWLGTGTTTVTASIKLGFKTEEYASTGASTRTGENSWDKLLIYEPGGGNGHTSDGTWITETVDFFSGNWWVVDRTNGVSSQSNTMTLAEMATSTDTVGGRTFAEVFALMAAPAAQLTCMQLGIGSYNAGGQVYINQLQTSFYRPGQVTVFGRDPGIPIVRCVPSSFDGSCEIAHLSLQEAVDAARDDDIVLVDSGTYTETVVLNKRLVVRGAAAGTNACGRAGLETVIQPADPGDAVLTLTTGADGAVIDGLLFQGGVNGVSTSGGPLHDLELRNSRFVEQTGAAIELLHEGSDISITGCDVDASMCTGGAGIALDADLDGLYLTNSCIHDGASCPGLEVLANASIGASASRSPAIVGNLIEGNLAGLDLGAGQVAVVEISQNQLSNNTGYGVAGGPVDSLVFDNLIAGNGGVGLALTSFGDADPGAAARNNLVAVNCFYGNGAHALELAADQASETIATNQAMYNDFRENVSGASYLGPETIGAELNWWGAEDGPAGDYPGSGDPVTGEGLDVVPFMQQPNTLDTPCHQLTDLSISMTDDAACCLWPGERVTYTLELSNGGPWDVVGALVENPIPANLELCSWSCSASGGGSCETTTGDGGISEVVNVPVGATVSYELVCDFSPFPIWKSAINRVWVSLPNGTSTVAGGSVSATVTTRSHIVFEDDFETGDTQWWSQVVP